MKFFKWGSRALDLYPMDTAQHKTYHYQGKVIIIGAGAAGLAAATVLENNNIDYVILEATDRYGGRLKENQTLADFPIDLGAEWIHHLPLVLNKLKGKTGDQIDEELVAYKLEKSLVWYGNSFAKPFNWIISSITNLIYSLRFKFFPEYKFKNTTWFQFIDKNFAQKVKHKIVFSSPVEKIDYTNDQVTITTTDGQSYQADKALVTVSIGILKAEDIEFVPAQNKAKKQAIADIQFLLGFKLIMKFSKKFYPDAILKKSPKGEKVFFDAAFKKQRKAHILTMLVTGDATQEYYHLATEADIISKVLDELDEIFSGQASLAFSGEYLFEDWGRQKFTKGSWVESFRHGMSTIEALNTPLDNRVFFAGEACDINRQLGVPGAIVSGYQSIDRLIESGQ